MGSPPRCAAADGKGLPWNDGATSGASPPVAFEVLHAGTASSERGTSQPPVGRTIVHQSGRKAGPSTYATVLKP